MKKITINRGDEYRAKVAKKISKDDFFENVYVKADSILNEIVREMDAYRQIEEEKGYYRIKYQGMGNNIILFCAGRGQGKTSAMQTFAEILRGGTTVEGLTLDENYYFHVLESIDPTALDGKESILRVLIARLFSEYERLLECKKNEIVDERRFKAEHETLLELFQQCFVNIDFLKGEERKDEGQDDLEYLAQMGNSAVLKTNLFNLIEQFFKVMRGLKNKDKCKKTEYLVVQIDDADLSIGDIYGLCEEIRNYLSIPNVVVIMAADYNNLWESVYKKYLNENRIFWHEISIDKKDKEEEIADCDTMAAKYMEKVFPSGHRINLPQIDDALSKGESLYVSYVNAPKGEKEQELLSAGGQKNLQEQLFLEIYNKTGIIFLKPEEGLHPFLPHTLRQLTHFLKLLSEMDKIHFDLVYNVKAEEIETKKRNEEVHKLSNNIDILNAYFFEYWCLNWLSDSERITLYKIAEIGHKKNSKRLHRIIQKYVDEGGVDSGDDTYQKVIYKIRQECESGNAVSEDLGYAFDIYFTLFFNGWFVQALEDQRQYRKIKKYLGMSVALPRDFLEKQQYSDDYPGILAFGAEVDKLDEINKDWREGQTLGWIRRFCIPLGEDGEELDDMIVRDGKKDRLSDEVVELKFNVFQGILSALDRTGDENTMAIETVSEEEVLNSLEAKAQKEERDDYMSLRQWISLKIILANADVQKYLTKEISNYMKRQFKGKTEFNWRRECREIYKVMDSWILQVSYLGEEVLYRFEDDLDKAFLGDFWEPLYYCSEHRQVTLKRYKKEIKEQINTILDVLERMVRSGVETKGTVADIKRSASHADENDKESFKYKLAQFQGIKASLENLREDFNELIERIQELDETEQEKSMQEWKTNILPDVKKCLESVKTLKDDESLAEEDEKPKVRLQNKAKAKM